MYSASITRYSIKGLSVPAFGSQVRLVTSLQHMARFLKPYRWVAVLLVFTVILPVTMELVVPRALQFIIDQGIRPGDMSAIWRGSLAMLAAALVGALATLGQGFCRAVLSQGLAFDMRNELFGHVQSFSFANLDHMQTGQLMTRLSSDVDQGYWRSPRRSSSSLVASPLV